MTSSEKAKSLGLKSLKEVSDMIGKPTQTLNNWAKNEPDLFKIVLIGCAQVKQEEEQPNYFNFFQ